jgi:streptogramin lyase
VINFDFATTGENPSALVVAADGTFWGTSFASQSEMLFHYTEATGNLQTVAMNFPLVNGLPSRGSMLTLGSNGNFYGIYTIYAKSGAGLFEIQPDGSNLQLFPFYTTRDGAGDPQTMLLATDGNLWIADYNGLNGYGDIITLSPSNGSLIQRLSIFSATAAIGAYPADLIQLSDGTLWGTTGQYGKATTGHFADGTVFSLNVGLPPR